MEKTETKTSKKKNLSVLLGAAFIMATSAIGPGFLTQTAAFTEKYKASFAFIILMTIIIDIVAQLNVWRVIGVSGLRGQDIANKVLPGLGFFVAGLICLGGLAFNIGNVAGAGMGLNVMFGISDKLGAVISAVIAILIFSSKQAGALMDKIAQVLGAIMIIVVAYVVFKTEPPMAEVAVRTVMPEGIQFLPIITLVGGTVGGYITFAGGHRLIDAGITGEENLGEISKSSVTGIIIASVMRILLFLAVLGVVTKGMALDPTNPAASAFQQGAGTVGYRIFGLVLFSAALTSIIGSAYTSVSFLNTLSPFVAKNFSKVIIAFITVSTLIFVILGKAAKLQIIAGALNGLILPITLGTILIASTKTEIVKNYKHSKWLLIAGVVAVIIGVVGGVNSLSGIVKLWQ
jgi:Mn2+/Fe2+ NRAMP family transporter